MQNIRKQLKYTTLNRIKPENHSRSNSTTYSIKIAQTDEKINSKNRNILFGMHVMTAKKPAGRLHAAPGYETWDEVNFGACNSVWKGVY